MSRTLPTEAQARVLCSLACGRDANASANDDFRGPLYWQNAMRVLGALKRRGWIDDNNEINRSRP